jgi:hypothetical protein
MDPKGPFQKVVISKDAGVAAMVGLEDMALAGVVGLADMALAGRSEVADQGAVALADTALAGLAEAAGIAEQAVVILQHSPAPISKELPFRRSSSGSQVNPGLEERGFQRISPQGEIYAKADRPLVHVFRSAFRGRTSAA